MKRLTKIFSLLLVTCMIRTPLTANAACVENTSAKSISFEEKMQALSDKYNVDISMKSVATSRTIMTDEQEETELKQLEERLAAGKAALEENNRQAEAAWQDIVDSGRCDENYEISQEALQERATHTVYYFQNIGSYYPNGTTIRCYIRANRVYSDYHSRYLWGSVVSTGSTLYSGYGSDWDETDCKTQRIDGGRTEYVQVWGDLEEKYTYWFTEYTVTSKGWRIWYEAYCPA